MKKNLLNRLNSGKSWFVRTYWITKLFIIAIVLLIGWFSVSRILAASSNKPKYQTAQVQKGSIISTVNESGNVTSTSQAGVGSPTTGIVEEIYVKDGDTVTQGQNLFKVKSIASAQEIASAWSAYQTALVGANTSSQNKIIDQATLEKDRQAVISASSAVITMQNNVNTSTSNPTTKLPYTQNDMDALNSALTSARETFAADEQKYNQSGQNIGAASASVNSAWLAYQATQDSVVTAPIPGTVANIAIKAGDQVTASGGNLSSNASATTTSSSNAILAIGNYDTPYVKVQASEVDITKIQARQKATMTLSAFSGKTFVGNVDQVDTAGTVTSGVVTYNVYVTFVAPPSDIKPGMSASVTIQTARKDDVLTVPTAAIQTANGQSTVRVLKNGKVSSVPVEIGIASDTDTEVTSGLSEGDTVVTGTVSTASAAGGSTISPFGRSLGGFGGGGGGGRRAGN